MFVTAYDDILFAYFMNYKSLKISLLVSVFLGFLAVGISYADEIKNLGSDFRGFNSLALANLEVSSEAPVVELITGSVERLKKPIVSITFDDGYESAYVYAPSILDKFGYKATYYVISNYIGGRGYMKAPDILDLNSHGNEIGAHTRNHPNLVSLSEAGATNEIVGSKKDLELLGLEIKTFAYPYGGYNKGVELLTKEAGLDSARTIETWYNLGDTDRFALGGYSVNSKTPLEKVFKYLDNAVANKTWAILVFHRIDENGNPISITHENFEKIIEYISKLDADVLTISDANRKISR